MLDDADIPALSRLLDTDPYVNVVVASRLAVTRTVAPARLGGTMLGLRHGGELVAGCYNGGNLVPFGGNADAWESLADWVRTRPRVCTSIVGRADAVDAMWRVLAPAWGPARSVRLMQPLLMRDRAASVPVDEDVQPAPPLAMERYLRAAVAMFTEELGVSPAIVPGENAFRARVAELIRRRRAFASFDANGDVVFKAEIGAVSQHTAQVQGVWVRPELRGRGIGTAGLAAVVNHALALAPTVSLYVNDFNAAALRVYDRLGMRTVATVATVLLA
jgi:predicted GNAT family acetyltransferase